MAHSPSCIPNLVQPAESSERPELLKEAERLWQQLDQLAKDDPKKYQSYIKNNLEKGVQEQAMQSAVVHAGLAIKCHALGKNSVRRQYINICQSVKVELPEEKEWDSWDGRGNLTLPMVLDDPRHRFDTNNTSYCVYDVIVHPDVFRKINDDPTFFDAVMKLAIQSIEQTFKLKFKSGFKRINSPYKGLFQWRNDGKKFENLSETDSKNAPDEMLDRVLRPNNKEKVKDNLNIIASPSVNISDAVLIQETGPVRKIARVETSNHQAIIHLTGEKDLHEFSLTVSEEDFFLLTPYYVVYYAFANKVHTEAVEAKFNPVDQTLMIMYGK